MRRKVQHPLQAERGNVDASALFAGEKLKANDREPTHTQTYDRPAGNCHYPADGRRIQNRKRTSKRGRQIPLFVRQARRQHRTPNLTPKHRLGHSPQTPAAAGWVARSHPSSSPNSRRRRRRRRQRHRDLATADRATALPTTQWQRQRRSINPPAAAWEGARPEPSERNRTPNQLATLVTLAGQDGSR
jgi:hypothetical protein